ncbi:MAG: hypothetical protein O2968_19510, partial [Acidobacteria bacterium]|nr:hypothetical protein [Acidobacteriota bacterium]
MKNGIFCSAPILGGTLAGYLARSCRTLISGGTPKRTGRMLVPSHDTHEEIAPLLNDVPRGVPLTKTGRFGATTWKDGQRLGARRVPKYLFAVRHSKPYPAGIPCPTPMRRPRDTYSGRANSLWQNTLFSGGEKQRGGQR